MKEARFYYTCRQCLQTFNGCCTGPQAAMGHLTAAMLDEKLIGGQRAVDRLALHPCGDDDFGLADLVGYRIEGEPE